MQYRVYSGPKGSADVSPLEKCQLLFKEFATLDDALSWARHLEGTGRIPLLIEGDDGTRMNRRAIADALRVGSGSSSTDNGEGILRQLLASLFHSARARSLRRFHLALTTSQFTIGRWTLVAFAEVAALWES